MLLAAARRFVLLTFGVAGVTVFVALVFGVLTGADLDRAISLGLYIVGSFLLVGGFFMGNRGPLRAKREDPIPFFGRREIRRATPEERREAVNTSAIFITVGLALILMAIAADSRFELF